MGKATVLPIRGLLQPAAGTVVHPSAVVAPARVVMAAAALVIVWIDPTEPATNAAATYAVLVAYALYALALLWFALRGGSPAAHRLVEIGDLAWPTALVVLSGGTSSVFFLLYLFCALNAGFQRGYAASLRTAIIAVLLFWAAGVIARPVNGFDLNALVLRAAFLLAVGHLAGHWGGLQILQRRRLQLLENVAAVSNPRLGADAALGRTLETLRGYFDTDSCLLAITAEAGKGYLVRRALAGADRVSNRAEPVAEEVGELLTGLPAAVAVVCLVQPGSHPPRVEAWRLPGGERAEVDTVLLERLRALLDARSLLSVPVSFGPHASGRLHLASRRFDAFERADGEFLSQAVEALALTLDNLRLADQLAAEAAEQERKRLARDLHDSVIQPYIGLALGLTSLRDELPDGHPSRVSAERLLELVRAEVHGLRNVVSDLKGSSAPGDSLATALRRFAARFGEATGVEVVCALPEQVHLPDALAGEVIQMVAEALSNVRRHTGSRRVRIELECRAGEVELRVVNRVETQAAPFTPKSLAERCAALGGWLRVTPDGDQTVVAAVIPR
jgi:signal transduction histidine kinase